MITEEPVQIFKTKEGQQFIILTDKEHEPYVFVCLVQGAYNRREFVEESLTKHGAVKIDYYDLQGTVAPAKVI